MKFYDENEKIEDEITEEKKEENLENKNEEKAEQVEKKEEIKKTDKNKKTKQEDKEETQKTEKNTENKVEDTKIKEQGSDNKKRKITMISIVSITILLILLLICTGFALLNINNNKIMNGISINGIKVEKLTNEEAEKKITEELQKNIDKDIVFKSDNFQYSVKLSQIEVEYNTQKAVQEAYEVGREGNIFVNNFKILKAMIFGADINIDFTYNEDLLNEVVSDMSVKVPNAVVDTDYYIEENKLIITKGTPGNSVDKDKIKSEIINRITNNEKNEVMIEIIYVEPNKIDIDKIYNEVHTEPQNAYYTKEPFKIFPHVNGIDFDIEAAKELLKEDKEEYEIDLTITEPEITIDKIGTEAFPDLLSTFSTRYDASQVGRSKNLRLAAEKIDGTVVMPGEVFSYNKTVGERTISAGYTEAAGYAGGKVVPTLGGGICQISSTLYDAVVYANLEIVERKNHMFLTSYVGAGKDATVVYGSIDFKFKNTRNYPIMIKSSVKNGIAKMDIYGIKEDVEYEVEISTKILSYIPYGVKYETDNSLAAGKEKVVQNGMNGVKSITYKILKLNGQQVSSTVLSTDTYDAMNKIIKRGPAETTTSAKPIQPEEKEEQTITNPINNEEQTEEKSENIEQNTETENNDVQESTESTESTVDDAA